jgi:hypothetical protein
LIFLIGFINNGYVFLETESIFENFYPNQYRSRRGVLSTFFLRLPVYVENYRICVLDFFPGIISREITRFGVLSTIFFCFHSFCMKLPDLARIFFTNELCLGVFELCLGFFFQNLPPDDLSHPLTCMYVPRESSLLFVFFGRIKVAFGSRV